MNAPHYDEYQALALLAETLSDFEEVRIRMGNRLRSLTTITVDEDGIIHGFGMPEDNPVVKVYLEQTEKIAAIEEASIKVVQKTIRNSSMGEYVKNAQGVGEKTAARLLGCIGDPYWHPVEKRPRTVSELWAYCGMSVRDGRAPRRTKGQQSNWNAEARKRVRVIAKSVEKQTKGKYRELYDATKAHYAGAIHTYDCAQCGPAGKPAQPGTPLKPSHIQARALRRVGKEVLKDMWLASKENHEAAKTQAT